MNIAVSDLARAVLKKTLNECSVDELGQMAHQYPYFAPAQLLLAVKLSPGSGGSLENSSRFEEQVQKASLYFQNRLWLDYLLNDKSKREIFIHFQPAGEEGDREKDKVQSPAETPEGPVMTNHEMSAEKQETPEESQPEMNVAMKTSETINLGAEPDIENAKVEFEPYHTVDYFASQGIKFKEEEKPKDRFGQQLKSFTEWLKTMKRIPVSEIPVRNDPGGERKVEQLAEHSLAEREVVTEAMAEVWEKQGNKEKAEEIYRKLSLLDPPKSSYFAAKIEELKKTS